MAFDSVTFTLPFQFMNLYTHTSHILNSSESKDKSSFKYVIGHQPAYSKPSIWRYIQ
jgi:hypothetical protein